MIYAYYTPHLATPINTQRGGTIRVGSDDPQPIQVVAGANNYLIFAFRDHNQKAIFLSGQTVKAKIYTPQGSQVLEKELDVLVTDRGLAKLELTQFETDTFEPGFYNLLLTITDGLDREMVASTMRSRPRFVLDVVDFSSNT